MKLPLKIAPKLGDININFSANEQSPRFELRQVGSLKNFNEAKHNTGVEHEISRLKKNVSQTLREFNPLAWLIVGRVDMRNLRPVPARTYGSNQGLAMARAAWVRDEIFKGDPLAKQRTVVTIGGPEHLGPVVTSGGMAADRAVEIYALIAQRQDRPPQHQ